MSTRPQGSPSQASPASLESPASPASPDSAPSPWGTQGIDLEGVLGQALPGLTVLDRKLELDGALNADLVAIDASGRLVLVLLRGPREALDDQAGERTVLGVLDALVWARRHRDLLARHLNGSQWNEDLEPRVVVVAERFGERVAARLSTLDPDGVLLLEVRSLRTEAGASTYLVDPTPHAARAGHAASKTFLEGLDEDLRGQAELLLKRLGRIDPGVHLHCTALGLRWTFREHPLCALTQVGGHLEGSLSDASDPLPLHEPGSLEAFVDLALRRFVELSGSLDDGVLEQVDLIPVTPRPLLSASEFEALHP